MKNHLVVRTVLIIVAGVMMVGSFSTAYLISIYRGRLLADFEEELENKEQLIKASYAVPLWNVQTSLMRAMNEAILSAPPYAGVVLYDKVDAVEGYRVRLATRKRTVNGEIVYEHAEEPLVFENNSVVEYTEGAISYRGREIGKYTLFFTRRHLADHLRTSLAGLVISFLLTSLATVLALSFLLKGSVITRLFAIVEFAKRVARDQDYNTRIPAGYPDEMGELADAINNMLEQIERKDTERRKAQNKLKESEAFRKRVFESSRIPLVVMDGATYRYLDCNPAAVDIYGYKSREEALGKTPMDVSAPVQYDGTPSDEKALSYIQQAQEKGFAVFEWLHKRPDGELWDAEVHLLSFNMQDQELMQFSLVDITERKRAEADRIRHAAELKRHRDQLEEEVRERTAQLEYARDQAEGANRAKTEFLSRMSHELRTPLNAILGYTQVFLGRTLDDDISKGLKIMNNSGEHLLGLINDILSLSKIESGKLELTETAFDLRYFIDGISELIRSRAEARGVAFHCHAERSLPAMVSADETRLRQILLNLLSNAVKFTPEGSITLRVISNGVVPGEPGKEPSTILQFEVEDTGIGIAEADLPRLFAPFEQVGGSGRWSEGTGLGLAISRQLVRLMNGDLHVSSRPGAGSRFWFTIPALVVDDVPEKIVADDETIPVAYEGPRKRILVADDIPSNLSVLTDLLAPLGFELSQAANGQEAVERAMAVTPDLILMDCHMPVMDGFAAAEQIKREQPLCQIPIVAVTASVMESDMARTRQSGFDAFLPKPVRWSRLAALISELLGITWQYGKKARSSEQTPAIEALPSREELALLLDLVRGGDLSALEERARQLREIDSSIAVFADRLISLAHKFEDRKLEQWLQQLLGNCNQ